MRKLIERVYPVLWAIGFIFICGCIGAVGLPFFIWLSKKSFEFWGLQ
jgi:hypothetical protein